ncbi:MAG: T9SS type A sorting domain-containing protein, partial [Ignavibacteria bacterium]|nr:T9SS type A sorting domain-containing protein [Ignavibacteria bacterium]
NNRGFEVERKLSGDNNIWNKVAFIEGSGNSDESKSYTYRDNNLTAGKYNYRLKQVDYNGNYEYYELQNEVVIGVPVKFELNQNYPNPFNPTTKINFSLPVDTKITLSVYDISGRLVASLINNEFRTADYYTVDFNGSNLASGVYFYTIQTGKFTDSKKMILVK